MRGVQKIWGGFVMALALVSTSHGLGGPPSISAEELVRRTVQNELKASQDSSVNHMFLSHKTTLKGSQIRLYCQTRDATAGITLENDGKPLTVEQQQQEQARLESLVHNPEELKKKREQEKADAERASRIVRAMPGAFLFEYDGTEPGRMGIGKPGDELVRLKFRPNPHYDPPTHVEQVLVGMEGTLLIDANQYRIAQIDGTLFREVSFGWGILGHLDKGGKFLVEQADLGDGSWDATRMKLSFTGRILFFKRLDIKSDEILSDYRRVPSNLTFAQGVALLRQEQDAFLVNRADVTTEAAEGHSNHTVPPSR
jgi:hypothetical protein